MSWKPCVRTGSDPKWYVNSLCFATEQEALDNAHALAMRWMAVTDWSAQKSNDPVTHTYVDGQLGYVAPHLPSTFGALS